MCKTATDKAKRFLRPKQRQRRVEVGLGLGLALLLYLSLFLCLVSAMLDYELVV
jgi:hypothetical protein